MLMLPKYTLRNFPDPMMIRYLEEGFIQSVAYDPFTIEMSFYFGFHVERDAIVTGRALYQTGKSLEKQIFQLSRFKLEGPVKVNRVSGTVTRLRWFDRINEVKTRTGVSYIKDQAWWDMPHDLHWAEHDPTVQEKAIRSFIER
jgi:hypothetical protein